MKKLIATVVAVLGLVFGTTTFALAQSETLLPLPPQTDYVLALWKAPAPRPNHFPQTLVTVKYTDDTSLDQLDDVMVCGTTYQVDLYVNDEITADLVKGGRLNAPGNPRESWPGGRYKSAYSKVVTTDPCQEPQPQPEPAGPATPAPAQPTFTG